MRKSFGINNLNPWFCLVLPINNINVQGEHKYRTCTDLAIKAQEGFAVEKHYGKIRAHNLSSTLCDESLESRMSTLKNVPPKITNIM